MGDVRSAAARWVMGLMLTTPLWLAGCMNMPREISPAAQRELYVRAKTLLLRAAQSDLDVIQANSFEALVTVDPDDAKAYFRTALGAQQPLVRFAACVALGDVHDCDAITTIRKLLQDREPRVRLAAAYAAYICGETGNAQLLVDTLNDHPDEAMRSDAAFLIGRLGEYKALARLELALRREKSGKVRTHIYTAMAALGDRRAVDELINATLGDTISRLIALQGLGEIADPRSTEVLDYCLTDEEEYLETRLIAARALGRLGRDEGFRLALDSLDHVGETPTDTMRVRSLAAHALGAIGNTRALAALGRLAESDGDPRTQVAACYAICEIAAQNSSYGQ